MPDPEFPLMSRPFDPIQILRSISHDLLRQLFQQHHGVPPVPWASFSRRNPGPLLTAWNSMSAGDRSQMQLALHEIYLLATDDGLRALAQSVQCRHADRFAEFQQLENRFDQCLWAWLHAHEAFEEAALFARADELSSSRSWSRWQLPGAAPTAPVEVTEQQVEAFRLALQQLYWTRELRGQHCRVNYLQRHTGQHYFFAYLDNWPNQLLAFQNDGELETLAGRYAFHNVFAWDSQAHVLELAAGGGQRMQAQLPRLFCRAFLSKQIDAGWRIRPAYQLDHLLTDGLDLQTDPEDRISRVRLTRIRVAWRAVGRSVQYEEIGFRRTTPLAEAQRELRGRLLERAGGTHCLQVKSVGFQVYLRGGGGARDRSFSFHVNAPNTCNLKEKTDDIRAIGERCLKLWGIARA